MAVLHVIPRAMLTMPQRSPSYNTLTGGTRMFDGECLNCEHEWSEDDIPEECPVCASKDILVDGMTPLLPYDEE